MTIQYPWYKSSGGPTPPVLWVCTICGTAFWAIEVQDRRFDRRYTCSAPECSRRDDRSVVRRATAEETAEAELHVKVGGERETTSAYPRRRRNANAFSAKRRKKAAAKAARKARA